MSKIEVSNPNKIDKIEMDSKSQNRTSLVRQYSFNSEIKDRHDQITEDFLKLSSEIEADGLLDSDIWSNFIGTGNTMVVFLTGLYLTFYCMETSIIYGAFGIILLALAGGPSLLFGKEGLIMGLSTSGWKETHNKFHAMSTNKTENLNRTEQNDLWFHFDRFWFLFWDALVVTLSWKLNYHLEFVIVNECWLELVCMIVHYSLIPLLGFKIWFVVTWLSSIFMVINLILSHYHKNSVVHSDTKLHWIENVFMRVTNIRPFYFGNWWTVHLNYQIEHHLFPGMPYHKLMLCSNKVRKFAEKYNLPYKNCSFWEACKLAYYDSSKEIILL